MNNLPLFTQEIRNNRSTEKTTPLFVLNFCSNAISVLRRSKYIETNNDKKRARLNCINHLLRPVTFDGFNNTPVTVRGRVFDSKFEPQTLPDDLSAPEAYLWVYLSRNTTIIFFIQLLEQIAARKLNQRSTRALYAIASLMQQVSRSSI